MNTIAPLRLAITVDDRITIDGLPYRAVETRPSFLLRAADGSRDLVQFTLQEFDEIAAGERFQLERNYYSITTARARMLSGVESIIDLPEHEQQTIVHKMDWCVRYLADEASTAQLPGNKRVKRSDKKMKLAVRKIATDIFEHQLNLTKRADVKLAPALGVPHHRTLLKWVIMFELSGYNPLALRDGRYRSGNRSIRFDDEVYALMVKYRREYLTPNQPLLKDVYYNLKKEIEALNKKRIAKGLKALSVPDDDTFSKFINSLDKYFIEAGRNGAQAADKKYYIAKGGQLITQIGQLVEMDEWTVQLHKLLLDADVYHLFSEEEQQVIRKTRWTLSVAEDAASRVILAMNLAPTASVENALQTLEMVFQDKTAYADEAGCQTAWRFRTGISMLRTDNGSAYVSERFRSAAVAIGATFDRTPAGRPQLRGRIERFFSTLAAGLSVFEGRTFKDAIAGAHYPSEERAVLTAEEVGKVIVRLVLDVYHNSPHGGLGGASPAATFDRLERESGVIPLPDKNIRRVTFGRRMFRRITAYGIEVGGLFYQHERLQAFRRKHGDGCKIEVALDESDVGYVSAHYDEGWSSVACTDDSLRGVCLDRYAESAGQVQQAREEGRENVEEIIDAARRSFREANTNGMKRANIATLAKTDKQFEQQLKMLTLGFGEPVSKESKQPAKAADELLAGGYEVPARAPKVREVPKSAGREDFDLEDME